MHENDSDDIEQIISDLYSDVSLEKPSSALDEKILSDARKELQQKPSDAVKEFSVKGAGPFSGRWTVPASLAAVIILSVTVVVTIEKERPYQLTSPPDELVIAEDESSSHDSSTVKPLLKGIAKNEATDELKAEKRKATEPLVERSIKDQEKMALTQRVEPARRQLAKKSVPVSESKAEVPGRQQDAVSAEDKFEQAPHENIGSAGTDGSSAVEAQIASAPVKLVVGEKDQVADRPTASEDSASEPGEFATFATTTKPKPAESPHVSRLPALAKRTDSGVVDEPVSEQAKPQSIQPVEAEAAAVAPAATLPAPAQAFGVPARENAVAESESQSSCFSLSVTDCLNSVECTLESGSADTDYQCRAANNQCESGFSQANDTRETCESRPGCQYKAANCFCPPGVECVCGGGPPAACVPE